MSPKRGVKRGPYKKRTLEELAEKERVRRETTVGAPLTDEEIGRFRAMVDTSAGPDACWPWTGSVMNKGYGHLTVRSRVTGAFSSILSHRFAFWIAKGRPPVGKVRHDCDNPPCCNPAHLREGTQKENIRDAIDRGRFMFPKPATGSANLAAKLTEDVVPNIRLRLSLGESSRDIGAAFGVAHSTILKIANGRTWGHVK